MLAARRRRECSLRRRMGELVSSPDPFPYAHAREIIGGWRKSEGKGLANRVYRPSTGNGRNAGAVRMECILT